MALAAHSREDAQNLGRERCGVGNSSLGRKLRAAEGSTLRAVSLPAGHLRCCALDFVVVRSGQYIGPANL